MLQVPEKLFRKAAELGFDCSTDWREHCIKPVTADADWQLIYRDGHWILLISGIPQMHLRYAEVTTFLERRSRATTAMTAAKTLQTA